MRSSVRRTRDGGPDEALADWRGGPVLVPLGPDAQVLMAVTGFEIDGGIAGVNRCILRVLVEAGLRRVDSVALLGPPAPSWAGSGSRRTARGRQWRFVWHLWRLLSRGTYDLVFFDHVGLARSLQLKLPGLSPRRYAVFLHGGELQAVTGGSRRQALARADLLVANSDFTAREVGRIVPEAAERVRVTPLCVDPERVREWKKHEADAGPPVRAPAVLIVGRMWASEPGKGHDSLLESWSEVRQCVPDAELWICGEGDDRPRLKALARERSLEGVAFLGRVSDRELSERYRRASVFCMPSRQEGFGLVYAEAMWHGLPCIGSTSDAAGTVIDDGRTGHLVPFGDHIALAERIVSLLEDPVRARAMGEAGRARVLEHFTYSGFASRFVRVLGLAGSPETSRSTA